VSVTVRANTDRYGLSDTINGIRAIGPGGDRHLRLLGPLGSLLLLNKLIDWALLNCQVAREFLFRGALRHGSAEKRQPPASR
jgi:hypothetical protein